MIKFNTKFENNFKHENIDILQCEINYNGKTEVFDYFTSNTKEEGK